MIRLDKSEFFKYMEQKNIVSFSKRSFDIIDILRTRLLRRGLIVAPVYLEIRYINHISSLQFSLRMTCDDKVTENDHFVAVEEKLIVAYFSGLLYINAILYLYNKDKELQKLYDLLCFLLILGNGYIIQS